MNAIKPAFVPVAEALATLLERGVSIASINNDQIVHWSKTAGNTSKKRIIAIHNGKVSKARLDAAIRK